MKLGEINMLIGLMEAIAIFYYWTWFIWPFVFIFSFAHGLVGIIKNENPSRKGLWIAATSFLIILAGIVWPNIV